MLTSRSDIAGVKCSNGHFGIVIEKRQIKQACVVCYPTEMLVAQKVADAVGIPLVVSEVLTPNAKFYVLDPLSELDYATVKWIRDKLSRA